MDFKNPAIYISSAALLGVIGEAVYFKREVDNLNKVIAGLVEENKKRTERDKEIFDLLKKYEHNMKIYTQNIEELNSKIRSLSSSVNTLQKKVVKEVPVGKGKSKPKIVELDSDSDVEDEEDESINEKARSFMSKYEK